MVLYRRDLCKSQKLKIKELRKKEIEMKTRVKWELEEKRKDG